MNKKLLVLVTALVLFSPVAQAGWKSKAAAISALWLGATLYHMNSKFKKPNPNPQRPACDSFKGFLKNLEFYAAPWGDWHQPDLDPKVAELDENDMPCRWYPKVQPSGLGWIAAHGKGFEGITKTAAPFLALSSMLTVAGVPFEDQKNICARAMKALATALAGTATAINVTAAKSDTVNKTYSQAFDDITFGLVA